MMRIVNIIIAPLNILPSIILYRKLCGAAMSEQRISIIMPVLNVNSHLGMFKSCILGLRNQSLPGWELVIAIDGGANKKDIQTLIPYLESVGDERIRLFVLRQNKPVGPGILRNYCLKYTSGSMLTFHDSDDFSEKNRFEMLMAEAKTKGLEVIASYVQVRYVECAKDSRIKGYTGSNLKAFVAAEKVRAPMHMSSAIISRNLFEKMGGFEHYKFSSDSIFTIKLGYFLELLTGNGICILKEPLFVWNRQSESITMDQKNAKTLSRCIGKQRHTLAEKLREMNFDSYIASEENIKKFVDIKDSLAADKMVNLELLYEVG